MPSALMDTAQLSLQGLDGSCCCLQVCLPYIAPSLGGVESLIEQPTVVSYWDQGPEKRAALGIKDNLIRFSCGIEDVEDIWADMEQALNRI